ncbi:MAG: diaminopimelate decarboxylase [Candidatus Rokuibacteriota bacterium]
MSVKADRIEALLSRFFPGSGDELVVGGLSVGPLAERFGTPLYVYDAEIMDRKWSALRHAYPPEFSVYYSVKANPNRAVLRHFLEKGCGLEVASVGELGQALAAGCPAERILFAGPGKTEAELERAVSRAIGEIHIESRLEAQRIGSIARRLGLRPRVAVRVNPAPDAQGGAMRMGGKPAPFGVDEEQLEDMLALIEADPYLDLRGLHLFAGTQILDHTVLIAQYRHGLGIARRAAGRLGRPLETLDFGGGLGIPYFDNEGELDVDKLREGLRGLMSEVEGDPALAGTRFVVEPGRYLVGEAGIFVTRITDVKTSRGRRFVVLDGGMNQHLAASGNLGQVIKRNYPVAVANHLRRPRDTRTEVVGPLCTPLDTLARDVMLASAEAGDLFVIFQSGAYGLTASPVGFLGHPIPAEVLVASGTARLIRPRTDSYPAHPEDSSCA